jgi:type I restriction enzyme M protein
MSQNERRKIIIACTFCIDFFCYVCPINFSKMEIQNSELQSKVNNIYNHLYANSFKRTPHGISVEVGKVLHTAMFIEEMNIEKVAFNFNSRQLKDFREDEVAINSFAENIQRMFDKMNSSWNFYEQNDQINMSNFDLTYTCIQLNGMSLLDTTKDIFGDTIEIIRGQWAKQVGGQFFTDSLVTKLSMTFLDFDPRKGDDLVDICSGTGGFLLAGLNHIRELLEKDGEKNIETTLVSLARKSLKGQEIDSDVCQIANATLETRLGKPPEPFVINGDSIKPDSFENNKSIRYNSHRCVASNPPFGTKITIKDFRVLREYELAKHTSKTEGLLFNDKLTFRAPDILFLEQNIKLLIPGEGRLAIVLPYQILSGPQTLFVRNWLLKNTIIESVIDLPSETFQPHTGTKTCLLTVKRRKKVLEKIEDIENYKIFKSIPKWIGHDRRGTPVFKKLPNGKNSNEILTDFPEVKAAYLSFLKGNNPTEIHQDSFVITSKDVVSNDLLQINASFHRPSKFDAAPNTAQANKNWEFVPLGQLVKNIFYPVRFKRDYVEQYQGAVPFFGGADINQLITETGKWISPLHPKIEELRVKKHWLLITRSGSTGIVSFVPDAWDGFAMSEHIIRIVPDENKINPFYLLAFLRSKYCQEIIAKGVFGSVIDEIDPNALAKIKVPVPFESTQLNQISKQVETAEKARNEAILSTQHSLSDLNAILETEFAIC